MASIATTVTDPWEIVDYEAKMLFGLRGRLNSEADKPDGDVVVTNAIVESACLHTRIMIDILLSKDSGKRDDIRLKDLLPGFAHPRLDRLRDAYGQGGTEGTPCWVLNKMIAHPTIKRGKSRDYTDLLRDLLPLIEDVWREIDRCRGSSGLKLGNANRTFDPRFCAKTCS